MSLPEWQGTVVPLPSGWRNCLWLPFWRLHETETFKDGYNFEWLQYGARSHCHVTTTLWIPKNSVSSSGSPSSRSNSTTSLRL